MVKAILIIDDKKTKNHYIFPLDKFSQCSIKNDNNLYYFF